ncbi:MAG: hypothetical protein R3E31_24210 [Chloroflexota bacterium]
MVELKHPRQIKVWEPLFLFVAITMLIIYAINALNTQDWLWFASKTVDATPDRIVIWHDGEQRLIQPGHDDFIELARAANVSLSRFSNTDLIHVDFNEETEAFYAQHGTLVTFFYDNPLDFHAPFRTGKPTQLAVPVNGRHAGYDYFFRGDKGVWWFGAMRMADSGPLLRTLAELGYVDTAVPASN